MNKNDDRLVEGHDRGYQFSYDTSRQRIRSESGECSSGKDRVIEEMIDKTARLADKMEEKCAGSSLKAAGPGSSAKRRRGIVIAVVAVVAACVMTALIAAALRKAHRGSHCAGRCGRGR